MNYLTNDMRQEEGYVLLYKMVIVINCAIIALSTVEIVIKEKKYVALICILYVLIIALINRIYKNSYSVGIFLFSIWFQIIGPLEMVLMQFDEESIVGRAYLRYINLMQNQAAYWSYFFYSSLMYMILCLSYVLVTKISNTKYNKIVIRTTGIGKIQFYTKTTNFLVLIVASIITYILRKKFNLDVPGTTPLIVHAGMFVYGFQSLELLLLYKTFVSIFEGEKLTVKECGLAGIACLIYGMPSILLDQRSPLFTSIIVLVVYLYSLKQEYFIAFIKKNKMIIAFAVIGFFVSYQILTTYIRYEGEYHVSILYIFSRLVGLAPGLIFYDYISQAGESIYHTFGFIDFFDNALGSRSTSINKVFTFNVLGYSSETVHASSVPPFIGAQLYHGVVGIILISIMYGMFIAVGNQFLKSKNSKYVKFIGSFMLVRTIMILMGGSVENLIELFAVPVITFLLYYI